MSSRIYRICQSSKPLLKLLRPNRGLIVFGFFLVLSSLFWLSTALNEYYDYEVAIPIKVEGLPKNVIMTSDIADTVRVTVRDKGYALMQYTEENGVKPIVFNFPNYSKRQGRFSVSAAELHKMVSKKLLGSSVISAIKPEKLDYAYAEGVAKQVPIRVVGNIVPAANHYLAHTQLSQQRVMVYAPKGKIDSIKYVTTENVNFQNFTDTIRKTVGIKQIPGVRIAPNKVLLTICSDVLTEEEVEVPITAINVPDGITMRTFPARVKVRFAVGVAAYRSINTGQFKVVIDYNDTALPTDKCPLYISQTPHGIGKANLEITEVDYLIEN